MSSYYCTPSTPDNSTLQTHWRTCSCQLLVGRTLKHSQTASQWVKTCNRAKFRIQYTTWQNYVLISPTSWRTAKLVGQTAWQYRAVYQTTFTSHSDHINNTFTPHHYFMYFSLTWQSLPTVYSIASKSLAS